MIVGCIFRCPSQYRCYLCIYITTETPTVSRVCCWDRKSFKIISVCAISPPRIPLIPATLGHRPVQSEGTHFVIVKCQALVLYTDPCDTLPISALPIFFVKYIVGGHHQARRIGPTLREGSRTRGTGPGRNRCRRATRGVPEAGEGGRRPAKGARGTLARPGDFEHEPEGGGHVQRNTLFLWRSAVRS